MARRAVVTGATGHVGAALVRALDGAGWHVVAAGAEPVTFDAPGLRGLPIERAQVDVRDRDALTDCVRGADAVFNLAGRVTIAKRDPMVGPINVGGAANVVDACRDGGVGRLVHVSSIHALAPADRRRGEDRSPTDGRGHAPYDKSKARGESIVRDAAAHGLDAVVVNPTGVFGPWDHGPSMLGRLLLDVWARRLPAAVPGGFSWVDVRDVADGIVAAHDHGERGERYVLAGHWATIRDLVDQAATVGGVRPPRVTIPRFLAAGVAAVAEPINRRTGRPHRFSPSSIVTLRHYEEIDHRAATEALGYRPRPLHESLVDTRGWFVSAGYLPG